MLLLVFPWMAGVRDFDNKTTTTTHPTILFCDSRVIPIKVEYREKKRTMSSNVVPERPEFVTRFIFLDQRERESFLVEQEGKDRWTVMIFICHHQRKCN